MTWSTRSSDLTSLDFLLGVLLNKKFTKDRLMTLILYKELFKHMKQLSSAALPLRAGGRSMVCMVQNEDIDLHWCLLHTEKYENIFFSKWKINSMCTNTMFSVLCSILCFYDYQDRIIIPLSAYNKFLAIICTRWAVLINQFTRISHSPTFEIKMFQAKVVCFGGRRIMVKLIFEK